RSFRPAACKFPRDGGGAMARGAASVKRRGAARFDLSGRRAFVTGGGRGIGRALALGLVEFGAAVALGGRDREALEHVVQDIVTAGGAAIPVSLDVRQAADCARAVADAADALGGLDILINNAGIEEVRPSLLVDEALWDLIVDTNLKGAFFCSQAAAKA